MTIKIEDVTLEIFSDSVKENINPGRLKMGLEELSDEEIEKCYNIMYEGDINGKHDKFS